MILPTQIDISLYKKYIYKITIIHITYIFPHFYLKYGCKEKLLSVPDQSPCTSPPTPIDLIPCIRLFIAFTELLSPSSRWYGQPIIGIAFLWIYSRWFFELPGHISRLYSTLRMFFLFAFPFISLQNFSFRSIYLCSVNVPNSLITDLYFGIYVYCKRYFKGTILSLNGTYVFCSRMKTCLTHRKLQRSSLSTNYIIWSYAL